MQTRYGPIRCNHFWRYRGPWFENLVEFRMCSGCLGAVLAAIIRAERIGELKEGDRRGADHECTFVGNDRHTPMCMHCGELMDLVTAYHDGPATDD